MPDHLGRASSFAPLLIAVEATDQLRVGTLVLNNDFFLPVRLDQEAATVDVMTGGRLELGVGSGWARAEYDVLGIGYDRPPDRAARLAYAVRTMKRAWSGDITVPGNPDPVAAVPTPVQQPHPPLLIGGDGDAVLALAAAEADIIGFTGLTWTGSSLEPTGASLESLTERAALSAPRLRHGPTTWSSTCWSKRSPSGGHSTTRSTRSPTTLAVPPNS